MIDDHLARARSARPEWDRDRHDRVKRAVDVRFSRANARRKNANVVRSVVLGAALLLLMARGLAMGAGSSVEPAGEPAHDSERGPRVAYDDAGFRGDVAPD